MIRWFKGFRGVEKMRNKRKFDLGINSLAQRVSSMIVRFSTNVTGYPQFSFSKKPAPQTQPEKENRLRV